MSAIFPLALTIAMPPSKNALRGSGRRRVYPTVAYRKWLNEASVVLWLQLRTIGHWKPDATRWWSINGVVWLSRRQVLADVQNYEEAIFDLLEGAQVDRRTRRIVKPGALYTNDRRVRTHTWALGGYVDPPHARIELSVEPCPPPLGWAEPVTRPRRRRVVAAAIAALVLVHGSAFAQAFEVRDENPSERCARQARESAGDRKEERYATCYERYRRSSCEGPTAAVIRTCWEGVETDFANCREAARIAADVVETARRTACLLALPTPTPVPTCTAADCRCEEAR